MRQKRKQLKDTDNTTDDQTEESIKNNENLNDGKDEIAIQSVITRKHRIKSQELLNDIQNDDPNEVMKEIHDVKDIISEKIKNIKGEDDVESGRKTRDKVKILK